MVVVTELPLSGKLKLGQRLWAATRVTTDKTRAYQYLRVGLSSSDDTAVAASLFVYYYHYH